MTTFLIIFGIAVGVMVVFVTIDDVMKSRRMTPEQKAQRRAEGAVRYEAFKAGKAQTDELRRWAKSTQHGASMAGFTLYPGYIARGLGPLQTPERKPLAGVSASVEASGGVGGRATLTRSLAPGMHGRQKKEDTREVQVVIDGPDFQWVGRALTPNVGATRKFAARVNTAARNTQSA